MSFHDDLEFDPEALQALADAKERLIDTRGASDDARKRYKDLVKAIQQLPEHPYRHRASLEQPGTRILSVSKYRVIYEPIPDTGDTETVDYVRVLAILPPGKP